MVATHCVRSSVMIDENYVREHRGCGIDFNFLIAFNPEVTLSLKQTVQFIIDLLQLLFLRFTHEKITPHYITDISDISGGVVLVWIVRLCLILIGFHKTAYSGENKTNSSI